MINLFNTCVGTAATGQIFGVIDNSQFDGLQQMMSAFTDFKNKLTDVQALNTTSQTTATPLTQA